MPGTETTPQESNPWLAPDSSNDWPAPDSSAAAGAETYAGRADGWPVGPPTLVSFTDSPTGPDAATVSADAPKDRDPVDDMWWPVDEPKSAAGRVQSKRSWAIAGVAAVVLTLLAIFGINAASSHTNVATGPGGGFNGQGFPGGGNGGFPPNGGFGANGQRGNRTGQNGNASAFPGQNGANGQLPSSGGFPGAGSGTSGSITGMTASGFTLAAFGGQTVEVTTNAATQVVKIDTNAQGGQGGSPGALADIKAGEQVSVVGDTANGTLTATIVLITSG